MKRNETAYELAMDDLTMGVQETIQQLHYSQ